MKKMETTQQNGGWVSMMDEESKKGGAFLKMLPTDQKIITIKADPVQGKSNFSEQGKEPKTEFRIKVLVEGEATEITWSVGNRNVMSQLVAIARQYKLQTLVGAKLMLKTSGTDIKNRAWFIMLMSAPGVQAPGFAQAPTSQPQDPGQAWIQGQMQDMAPAQGGH
jgi:hypothetical protein